MFPKLSRKYEVMGLPGVVINDTSYFEGALPEAHFLQVALQMLEANPARDMELVH